MKNKKVYLTLQNGTVFEGRAFGAEGEITGELVFSTGMVGYIETLTDPVNYGQIVVQTFPLIGNYGMMHTDVESDKAWVSAYIVREICDQPSNFRMEGTLEEYMKEQGVIGVYGVDTRQLTKILREEGAMNARISKKPLTDDEIKTMGKFRIENAVKAVAKNEKGFYQTENAKYTVAFWNFGSRRSAIENLLAQGCNVIDMPATSTAEEILATGAHGIVLSDGAGNPADNTEIIDQIAKVIEFVKNLGFNGCIMVDNCYGEFIDRLEPTQVGATLMAGSMIKNPGGGIAPTGGYIVGDKKYVDLVANRLTSPSIGTEVGSYFMGYQYFYQGLFLAPHVVSQAVKGALLFGKVLSGLGYQTSPTPNSIPKDIILAIKFNDREKLISFIQNIQKNYRCFTGRVQR